MQINMKYILVFLIILIMEIIIALFINDTIVRPYIGDILVVILMYTLIRGLIQKSLKVLPICLFLFAFAVELTQYYHIVDMLHLQDNQVISTIIGVSFDVKDILCYLIATVILIAWEIIEKGSNRR